MPMRFEDEVMQALMSFDTSFSDIRSNSLFDDETEADYAARPIAWRVIQSSRSHDGRPTFRIAGRLNPRRAELLQRILFPRPGDPPSGGVWIQGSLSTAREFLQSIGLRNVAGPETHPGGQPHIHATHPAGGRSQHVFYGRRLPRQNFFD